MNPPATGSWRHLLADAFQCRVDRVGLHDECRVRRNREQPGGQLLDERRTFAASCASLVPWRSAPASPVTLACGTRVSSQAASRQAARKVVELPAQVAEHLARRVHGNRITRATRLTSRGSR